MSTTPPEDDERLLGALAHASAVANVVNLSGMVAALLLWATQRERSRFVRAHAIQALAFQAAVLLAIVVMMAVWSFCLTLSLLPMALRPDLYAEGGPPLPFWVVLWTLLLPVLFGAAAAAYALIGAYQVWRGRPFRYPLAGRVARAELAALYPPPAPPAAPAAPLTMPAPPAAADAPPPADAAPPADEPAARPAPLSPEAHPIPPELAAPEPAPPADPPQPTAADPASPERPPSRRRPRS